ncbi:TBC1 domain family member 31 isoform X2 [Cephus cinctus]|uniref:TBC1 domain family member 31 isoform X2 n=1 Tax=Cephus cinctus TaxID=211228 RepID=A0AAJ7BHU4_CEPCN|nr:TBC1 domain family member 31 isoform X2 [Cephus cinctus]
MQGEQWKKLEKVFGGYKLIAAFKPGFSTCRTRTRLTQVAFDLAEERLVTVDSKGNGYIVELSNEYPVYKKLGPVGLSSFIAFNPFQNDEILVGLSSTDIKVFNLKKKSSFLLSGHISVPNEISFYKNYALTTSSKEAIIWDLKSCLKMHQLKLHSTNISLKRSAVSTLGQVAVLYSNDIIQIWKFKKFDSDTRVDMKSFGLHNVKDFNFTKDGKTMILSAFWNKILVLSTSTWKPIKIIQLPENLIGVKRIAILPTPLDGGSNHIIAILSSHMIPHFLDLNTSCFIDISIKEVQLLSGIKKLCISMSGLYIACIENNGDLILIKTEKLLPTKSVSKEYVQLKKIGKRKLKPHCTEDHLRGIQQSIKKELKLQRLLSILNEFGEYPKKHRSIIWTTVLQLPANRSAYAALANENPREHIRKDMLKDYPLSEQSKAKLLNITIDCLVNWCPLLGQNLFLPRLVFPFLVVFQNPILAFEAVLCVLCNYCQKWFEYYPLPPLNVLGIVENILLEADPALLNVLCEKGITSTEYAWPLLQTTLSEVLSGDEWMILWDHLWSYGRISLLLMCVVAYNICCREIIISILKTPEDFKKLYTTQGHISVKNLLEIAKRLDHQTPFRIHPSRYFRNKLCFLPTEGPYPPFLMQEYPKFLTDETRIAKFERLKEQNQVLKKHQQHILKESEEKRIHVEAENLRKQIHEARLNELRKCYDEKIRNEEWQLETAWNIVDKNSMSRYECTCKESLNAAKVNDKTDSEKSDAWNRRKCEELQDEVEKLEHEVHTLLETV